MRPNASHAAAPTMTPRSTFGLHSFAAAPLLLVVFLLLAATASAQETNDLPNPAPLSASAAPTPILKTDRTGQGKFHWGAAVRQSFYFLMIEHGYRLAAESDTRVALRGPFFRDWGASVAGIHGWGDGDTIVTNYVGHPIGGSVAGRIEIQNDPGGRLLEFSNSRPYWKSRLRATAWAALYSTQFEIGPLSEASIGNVGKVKTAGYVDLVVTPTAGTALIVLEDIADKYLVKKLEARTKSVRKRALYRTFMNPARTAANVLRGKAPWYRDNRPIR
jgi:hypothetical protein